MTTNVPKPQLTTTGYLKPQESEYVTGTKADINAACGGNVSVEAETSLGQIAVSEAAIISDRDDQLIALANNHDPMYADGRWQDAIGHLYYLTRKQAQATIVIARCTGLQGVIIGLGALAQDTGGNIYQCNQAGTIPVAGYIDLEFVGINTGAIACPIGHLNKIYRSIPGWDTVANLAAGTPGNDVETRSDFEFRRRNSVAKNSIGFLTSILGAVFGIDGVTDARVVENGLSVTSGASFTASMSGNTMTVTAIGDGTIEVGQIIVCTGIEQGNYVTALGSGTGGTGTYTISIAQTLTSRAMTCAVGGVRLKPHSIFICVYGGLPADIGAAILTKKSPGCDYNGNTDVIVYDTNYTGDQPSYLVSYQIPAPVSIKFIIELRNKVDIPANYLVLIRAAVIARFTGADGGDRERIGGSVNHSAYYAPIFAHGNWAEVLEIYVGVGTANKSYVLMRYDQIPSLSDTDIVVNLI